MSFYLWLFPLIFISHDMEEIIGLVPWIKRNKSLIPKKYYRFIKKYENVSTEGFAIAVFEELILCVVICILSYNLHFYGLWLGGFAACVFHFIIHIIESIVIRRYIPALITSIIFLPIGFFILYDSVIILNYTVFQVFIYSALGTFLIFLNLKSAHWLMKKFN